MTQNKGHIGWIDLHNDGVMQEIAVLKEDAFNSDLYYIAISDLDSTDKRRLIKILKTPNAEKYPLWELMANNTLGNGQNALDFFHQLVKIRTAQGRILPATSGKIGAGPKNLTARPEPAEAPRGRGRPPKVTTDAE